MKQGIAQLILFVATLALEGHGQTLFTLDYGTGKVGTYTTSGAPINPSLITGQEFRLAMCADNSGYIYMVGEVPSANTRQQVPP